ncbi:MAG: LapA family protein [Gammaproteobacteria bacterium]|nr:LapA family protein [Gammaproteobacteria bacterium]
MLKRVGLLILIIAIAILMATFTAINTGSVDIDLAFAKYTKPLPLVLTVAFAVGWLFGILCMGFFAIKLINERRVLRRALRLSESEVTSLRGLPLNDAD